jgi:hypothetical protein
MKSAGLTGRLAGLLYLIVVLTGIFSLAYVPSQLNVSGDTAATLANILASERLFRWGIASFLVEQVAFILLPLALFQLLSPVNRTAAILMVVLALVGVPLALVSLSYRLDVLTLIADPGFNSATTGPVMRTLAMHSLDAWRNGLHITSLFWGLWLLPFGYLVFKSGFLPRLLGVLLMLGCAGYLTSVFGDLLLPGYEHSMLAKYVSLPAALGEIGICLWLLLVGAHRGVSAAPR